MVRLYKGRGHSVLAQRGGQVCNISNPFANSAIGGGGWLAPRFGCFNPDKDPVLIVWEAGLDGYVKYHTHTHTHTHPTHPSEFDRRTVSEKAAVGAD